MAISAVRSVEVDDKGVRVRVEQLVDLLDELDASGTIIQFQRLVGLSRQCSDRVMIVTWLTKLIERHRDILAERDHVNVINHNRKVLRDVANYRVRAGSLLGRG